MNLALDMPMVLMLLPQSAAYETLKSRLNAISSLGVLHLLQKSSTYEARNLGTSIFLSSISLCLSSLSSLWILTLRQQ